MLGEDYSFSMRKNNISVYESKNLFLSFNGPFCPVSHKEMLISFAGARRFTVGLFCFGYLSDSRANDRRLNLAHGSVLKGAAGESQLKGAVPLAREPWSTDGAIRVGGIAVGIFLGVFRQIIFFV